MLEVRMAESWDCYDALASFLSIPEANSSKFPERGLEKIHMKIEESSVKLYAGELTNEFLNLLATRAIVSANNYDDDKEVRKTPAKISTGVKLPKFSKKREKITSVTTYIPKLRTLHWVDFGKDRGAGFDGIHPGIVYEKIGEGCYRVIPCTSQRPYDDKALMFDCSDEHILKDARESFAEESRGKTTYAIYEKIQPVDVKMFKGYLGEINETYWPKILSCYQKDKSKGPFQISDLNLNGKQIAMLGGKADRVVEIGNSSLTCEEKVSKVLLTLGFYPDVDEGAKFLKEALIKSNMFVDVDVKRLAGEIAKGPVSSEVVQQKINECVRKKYRSLYPCVDDFIKLVNVICYR